ncbi:MAG TPA: sigma-70 family RNA polymerase sigma factor [Bryobacteraceae bacterium]|nr:sigma-70 family RNA polymerase sigma factor [Bryobacteraceae bacterium]
MAASETILAKLRERIVAFAASRIGRPEAEDVAQETLLVLHEKYREVDSIEDLVPLSMRIVRFKMAALWRKSARHGDAAAVQAEDAGLRSDADPERELIVKQQRRLLLEALEELGERCREILKMKLAGLGFEQIRVRLGVESLNTVYVWDLRCRRQLIERLKSQWERPQ